MSRKKIFPGKDILEDPSWKLNDRLEELPTMEIQYVEFLVIRSSINNYVNILSLEMFCFLFFFSISCISLVFSLLFFFFWTWVYFSFGWKRLSHLWGRVSRRLDFEVRFTMILVVIEWDKDKRKRREM